jgi:nucleoid DNA-binding protein
MTMGKIKKKIVTIKSISEAVAKQQGITKGTAKAVVEAAFIELVAQFKQTGYVRIPGFGTIDLSISIRSGEARSFFRFKTAAKLTAWLKDLPKNPENEEFLEYLCVKDATKYERYEQARLHKLKLIEQWQANDDARDRARIAQYILDSQGIVVDPDSIPREALTPPRGQKVRLPNRYTTVREMLTRAGGIRLKKEDSLPNLESTTQSDQSQDSSSES